MWTAVPLKLTVVAPVRSVPKNLNGRLCFDERAKANKLTIEWVPAARKELDIMMKSKPHAPARIAMLIAALFATVLVCPAADAFYAQTTTTQSYSTFIGPIPISGLSFTIPAASSHFNAALVTLSLPNLFLSDNTSKTIPMAATFQIVGTGLDGTTVASGGIGCDNVNVTTSGIKPFSMTLLVPLNGDTQMVMAEWASNGTSTVTTQTFASISAILVRQ